VEKMSANTDIKDEGIPSLMQIRKLEQRIIDLEGEKREWDLSSP
jgi:hypothetical protein